MRTQVGIVGCGPAGLLLAQTLCQHGIESVIVERQDRAYVEGRIRAGVLEQGTVDLIREIGVSDRLSAEGLIHDGIGICVNGHRHRIDLRELTGQSVTIYGQTEITRDLIDARIKSGGKICFDANGVRLDAIETNAPKIHFSIGEESYQLECDFVAGCDGFHGVCRDNIPSSIRKTYERSYPFAWLGILAESVPPSEELIYARSPRGFALFSMRSKAISRNYIQCKPDEKLEDWPDDRVWDELRERLGGDHIHLLDQGPVLEKSVSQMRSFVVEPMQHGRLYLAGDSAHIVPPTGAKGLNLAAADVRYLAEGFIHFYQSSETDHLDRYSHKAIERVWKAQRFSWWMTSLLHNCEEEAPFQHRLHAAELGYLLSSEAAQTSLAENYVGLPFA